MGLILLLYPILEIYAWSVFIERFSFIDALAFAATGFLLGAFLLTLYGKTAFVDLQMSLMKGQNPANKVIHRVLIMFGSLMILVPGIISKAIGVFLVLPGLRHIAVVYIKWFFARKLANGTVNVFTSGFKNAKGKNFDFNDFQAGFEHSASREVYEVKPEKIEHIQKKEDI